MSQQNDIDLAVTGFYAITFISQSFIVPWCEGFHDKIFNNSSEKSDMTAVLISDMVNMANLHLKLDFVDEETEIMEYILTTSGDLSEKELAYIKQKPAGKKHTVPHINVDQLTERVVKFGLHESLVSVVTLSLTELVKDLVTRVTNPGVKIGFNGGKVCLYLTRPNQRPIKIVFHLDALASYSQRVSEHYKRKTKARQVDATNVFFKTIA